jgi:regulatory LuxR family protein
VLGAVAERLRNREIAGRLHVSVRTVESHVAALMRKLGVTDRAALAELGAELRRAARAPTALTAQLTSLIGRESETNELRALVDAHRLVTLIGPAGVGKTRLALHAATICADSFRDGARLADMAPVEPDLAGDTLARALSVVPQPGWSVRDVLREAASGMHCLLLVDNCEHVVAEAADIVADLLGAGGLLRVVATSREPLGRFRWQPPKIRRCTGVSRSCQRATFGSGERPCSPKCSVPPGRSTRRASLRAALASGIVQIVQVMSTQSMVPESISTACPSRPAKPIGTELSATRLAASFRPAVAGSTARTRRTPGG